jgi:transcriptional regulator with XRE-family HTH domain
MLFDSNQTILSSFAKRFKQARINAGLSQHVLAANSGISRATIIRFESGSNLSVLNLIELLRCINELDGFNHLLDVASIEDPEIQFKKESKQRKRARK